VWGGSSPSRRIFAYNRPTDMRKSFFGLLALVQQMFEEDPYSGSLFVFVNARGNVSVRRTPLLTAAGVDASLGGDVSRAGRA
jgi:transposase